MFLLDHQAPKLRKIDDVFGATDGRTAIRYHYGGEGIYVMRPYDPSFLWMFSMVNRVKDMTPSNAREVMTQTHLILDGFVKNETNARIFGLNKCATSVTMPLALTKSFYDGDDVKFESLEQFKGTKDLLLKFLDKFESDLLADVNDLHIYLLEKKRGYDIETLLHDIDDTLPADDRSLLSRFARDNMQEAGTCWLFDRYTACGYHMARAVEEVARRYYELVTGKPTHYKDRNDEWRDKSLAQCAGELQDVLNKFPDEDEAGLLSLIVPTIRQFCRIYRDPLSHADPKLKELKSSDAEIAFGHAITGISTMLEDVRTGGPHFKWTVTI